MAKRIRFRYGFCVSGSRIESTSSISTKTVGSKKLVVKSPGVVAALHALGISS